MFLTNTLRYGRFREETQAFRSFGRNEYLRCPRTWPRALLRA
jgi:hypothetical protein